MVVIAVKSGSNKTTTKSLNPDNQVTYSCTRCTRKYRKQKGNFAKVRSPLYSSNDGYLHICDHCLAELYQYYLCKLGTEEEAIRRVCMKLDIYYSDKIIKMLHGNEITQSPIKCYISRTNLSQFKSVSYDDTIEEEKTNDCINNNDDLDCQFDIQITKELISEWGAGFAPEEYQSLSSHYKMLTQKIDNIDFVQETLIRELCIIQVQKSRAMKDHNMDRYEKLAKLYQSTLSNTKLKINGEQFSEDKDAFGIWIAKVENYCPSEYYKDKKKYRDFFGIGEYCERYIYRPLKNLLTGSREKDLEHFIGDADA